MCQELTEKKAQEPSVNILEGLDSRKSTPPSEEDQLYFRGIA